MTALSMPGENALQNANTFIQIADFGANLLTCGVGLAEFHAMCADVSIMDIRCPLNGVPFKGNYTKRQKSQPPSGLLQAQVTQPLNLSFPLQRELRDAHLSRTLPGAEGLPFLLCFM